MWKTIGWLAMATGVALVPAILARIAPVSSLIAELGAGLATLALIPLVGAAASLRRSLKSYFGDHFEKRKDLMAAITILEGQISLWKRSLADGDSQITKVA
jgi:pheromone shutdown protein TraB